MFGVRRLGARQLEGASNADRNARCVCGGALNAPVRVKDVRRSKSNGEKDSYTMSAVLLVLR